MKTASLAPLQKTKIKIKQHHRSVWFVARRGTLSKDFNFSLRAMVLILDTNNDLYTGNDSIPPQRSGGKSWVVWIEGRGLGVGQKATVVPRLLKP